MDYDFNKAGLYPAAWAAFKANFLNMAGIAVALVFLEYLGPKFDSSVINSIGPVFLQIIAAFFIHQTIISGKLKHWAEMTKKDDTVTGFIWRSGGFLFILLVITVPFVVFALRSASNQEVAQGFALGLAFIFGMPIYGIFLAFFGTILPATVAQGNKSITAAFQRGRKTFWYAFERLIIGPSLFSVSSIALVVFLSKTSLPLNVYGIDGTLSPVGGLLSLLQYLAGLFVTTLAATVLCKAYLRYEQRPEQTPSAT